MALFRFTAVATLAFALVACNNTNTVNPTPSSCVGLPFYVANISGNSVTSYPAGCQSGNVAPTLTLSGNNTALSAPHGLAADGAGNLYVANLAGNSITVYSPSATGNAAPIRTISGPNTTLAAPQGIYVDNQSNLWVANSGTNSILKFPPNANGNVVPVVTIAGSATLIQTPTDVLVNGAGSIYVSSATSNSILIFAGSASGNTAPSGSISGTNTQLSNPQGIAFDIFSNLYVTNAGNTTVTIYSAASITPNAINNASPTATIGGAATGLAGPLGIATNNVAPGTGVYVTSGNTILYFAYTNGGPSATSPTNGLPSGNVAPAGVWVGPATGLSNPAAIL